MESEFNILLGTDSYKASHWKGYPPKTTQVYSYYESRGGRFPETLFFGLQFLLMKYLVGAVVTQAKIDEAEQVINLHMGPGTFNRAGWEYILHKYSGQLPISIRAVAEGTSVPVLTPLMTVENTDPNCHWLTNYLETLLCHQWYPITVATQSREIKKVILDFLRRTGDPSGVDFKLHDFGFRGVSSVESAGIGGCAHLVNFKGTDTMAALIVARDFYGCPMAGFSIPAAEHSTITSWGEPHEVDAFANMLEQFPKGLVAVVSDSFDIIRACRDHWGKTLKDRVLGREGTVVVRPDSGDPEETVLAVLEALGKAFGVTYNDKGYRVLPPQVRVIQGDGVNYDSIKGILGNMEIHKWSADNVAFGMGGALLQCLNRDTQKFAFKCSEVTVDGVARPVHKKPVGAEWKASKPGRFNVGPEIFRNGEILVHSDFDEVRKRAAL